MPHKWLTTMKHSGSQEREEVPCEWAYLVRQLENRVSQASNCFEEEGRTSAGEGTLRRDSGPYGQKENLAELARLRRDLPSGL